MSILSGIALLLLAQGGVSKGDQEIKHPWHGDFKDDYKDPKTKALIMHYRMRVPEKLPETSLIFTDDRTVPSVSRNSTQAAPRAEPPSSSNLAPTTTSCLESPLRSPTCATALPNSSPSSSTPVKAPARSLIF